MLEKVNPISKTFKPLKKQGRDLILQKTSHNSKSTKSFLEELKLALESEGTEHGIPNKGQLCSYYKKQAQREQVIVQPQERLVVRKPILASDLKDDALGQNVNLLA